MKMTNMTAVEWLVQQICGEHTEAWKQEIQQALEMEKQQIIYAHLTGLLHPLEMEATKQSEKYYSETYKKDK